MNYMNARAILYAARAVWFAGHTLGIIPITIIVTAGVVAFLQGRSLFASGLLPSSL